MPLPQPPEFFQVSEFLRDAFTVLLLGVGAWAFLSTMGVPAPAIVASALLAGSARIVRF